ncbi:MAG: hypothetical protein VKJ24_19710, partial [Synechococcales bacterium]|nr:hypothetical protein [Synechococcales bacterium]
MGVASSYYTLLRLEATGHARPVEQSSARQWLNQWLSAKLRTDELYDEELTDEQIQACLLEQYQLEQYQLEQYQASSHGTSSDATFAELCLRCYISQHIVYACHRLVQQFGATYRFQLSDLLPLVLDDEGRGNANGTLAHKILTSFKPEAGSLKNWITRLVRQHPEINTVLLEHGLYLVSDWAILNDTTPEQLGRILTQFYHLSPLEVQQNCHLLEAYRAVYLPSRMRVRSHRCH